VIHLESAEDVLIDLEIHLECRVRAGHLLRAVVSEDKQTCISAVLLSLSEPLEDYLQTKLPTRLAAFSLAVRAVIIHLSTPLFGSKSQLPPPNAPTGQLGFLPPPGRIPRVSPEAVADTEVTSGPNWMLMTTFSSGRPCVFDDSVRLNLPGHLKPMF
jgi:hypothetical protein